MTIRNTTLSATLALSLAAASLLVLPGCAVTRGQQSVGAYIDDTAITADVKGRFVENKVVDAAAISVETMKGEVMLSGFAKSAAERIQAEKLARDISGVKVVRNDIAIRP